MKDKLNNYFIQKTFPFLLAILSGRLKYNLINVEKIISEKFDTISRHPAPAPAELAGESSSKALCPARWRLG